MIINLISNQLSHVSISSGKINKAEQDKASLPLESIKNTPDNDLICNIDTLEYLPMKNISKYLNLRDVYNLSQVSIIYGDLIYEDKVREFKNKVLKWEKEKNIDKAERRDVAAKQIIECLEKRDTRLILNDLNLTSIPNLKSLTFIEEIHTLGCDIKNLRSNIPPLTKFVFSLPNQWNRDNYGFGHIVTYKHDERGLIMTQQLVCRDYGDNRKNGWIGEFSGDAVHLHIEV